MSPIGVFGNDYCGHLTVDASAAGEGTLELVVSTRQGSVRAEESIRARGVYNMTFLPTQPVPHFVNITFNDEDVPGMLSRCNE